MAKSRHGKSGNKRGRRTKRRAAARRATRRESAGLAPFSRKSTVSKGLRETREERERRERALAQLAVQTVVDAARAEAQRLPLGEGIRTIQMADFQTLMGPVDPGNVAAATEVLTNALRVGRVNQALTQQLARSLETIRRRKSRDNVLQEAQAVLPLARTLFGAHGNARPIPEGNRQRWRDIGPVLETLGRWQGLRRDGPTGRWRESREDEDLPSTTNDDPFDAVALLTALLRLPPPGPFANWKGFGGPPPPPPPPGASGFTFSAPSPPPGGFDF